MRYEDTEFDPATDADREAAAREAELARKIRREVLRVQRGEADDDLRADREAEQKKIEQTVSEPADAKQTTVSADAAPAEDEKRTTLSLSLTVSDKKALKMMAAERETTIAAIIHEWVAEHREDK